MYMHTVEEGWFVKDKWIENPEYTRSYNEKYKYDGVPLALIPIGSR